MHKTGIKVCENLLNGEYKDTAKPLGASMSQLERVLNIHAFLRLRTRSLSLALNIHFVAASRHQITYMHEEIVPDSEPERDEQLSRLGKARQRKRVGDVDVIDLTNVSNDSLFSSAMDCDPECESQVLFLNNKTECLYD
jgi:hypothetical protein